MAAVAKTLDAEVEAFRNRPLDAGPYTYVLVDALPQMVRDEGRIVNVACALATEDGAGRTAFLRGPGRPGPVRGEVVVSDAHEGAQGGRYDDASHSRSPNRGERVG